MGALLKIAVIFFLMTCYSALAQDLRRPGVGVDSQGLPVIDPTENVKALNEQGLKRIDDLRKADNDLSTQRYQHLKEVADLRALYEKEIANLRADNDERLRIAETKRIDAIRLVDTTAVAVQNERGVSTATTLAKTVQDSAQVLSLQVTKSADDLRTLVATTAAESSRSLQQQFAAITTRLSALEQGSVNTSGVGAGRSDVVGWVQSGLILMIGMGGLFLAFSRKPGR